MERKPITVGQLAKALSMCDPNTPLVCSSDEEGNNYGYVYYMACEGLFDQDRDDFCGFQSIQMAQEQLENKEVEGIEKEVTEDIANFKGTMAICIN